MNLLILESLVDFRPKGVARVKGPKGRRSRVPLMRRATLEAPTFSHRMDETLSLQA